MSATESVSPLKTWIKRHSPIKSRNKPLPNAPLESGSPTKQRTTRVPGRAVSGNASPTKASAADRSEHKPAKRKISALWKSAPSEEAQQSPSKHRRTVSSPVKHHERHDPSDSKESLSDKVSVLEAQLRAAKSELAGASNTIKHASPFKSHRSSSRQSRHVSHGDIDYQVDARQRALQQGFHYDGVVESLLEPDYVSATRRAAEYSERGRESPTKRSASAMGYYDKAMSDYKTMEDQYLDEGEQGDALEMARRRSTLRAAEWKRMQEHMAKEKRHRAGSKRSHDEVPAAGGERPARRQKYDKAMLRDKALPDIPKQDRPKKTIQGDAARSDRPKAASSQPESKAHTIQYVQVRSKTPEQRPAPEEEDVEPLDLGEAEDGNVEVFCDDDDEDYAPPSPHRRPLISPSRLHTVDEEFEWNDDEIF